MLFLESGVTLAVSLFSVDEQQYEADNGLPGSYRKVMRKLPAAARLFRGGKTVCGGAEIYRIAVHATAQADNIERLVAVLDFCAEEDIFFSVAPLASVGGGASMPEALLSPENEKILESLGDNSIILSSTSARAVGRQVCGTCLYGLNVSYNGQALFDAHAGYEIEGRLGSVRTSTVGELVRRQRQFAPYLFQHITRFCPVRDPAWPAFMADTGSVPGAIERA
jgi:MoaA/NifB/PqqE/SkfB family radical SAM enzyme